MNHSFEDVILLTAMTWPKCKSVECDPKIVLNEQLKWNEWKQQINVEEYGENESKFLTL